MRAQIRSFLSWLRQPRRRQEELESEIDNHIELYQADLIAQGLSKQEALRRARLEFGGAARLREECREAHGLAWVDELSRNVRYSFRTLAGSPVFALSAILTLALCIGANTAIFSIVDAVLLRPLPYPEPERLAQVLTAVMRDGRLDERRTSQTGAAWELIRDQVRSMDVAVLSRQTRAVNFVADNHPETVMEQRVSAGFFRVMGAPPIMGREFLAEEDIPNGPTVAIVSHSFWRRALDSAPSVLGREILLRGKSYSIVGVAAPDFEANGDVDLWTPLRASPQGEGAGSNYAVIGRLRDSATWPEANGELLAISGELGANKNPRNDVVAQLEAEPLQMAITGDLRQPLFILWSALGAVLLIGCINVAALMLARSAGRGREFATRASLGGGPSALARQLLTESLTLATCGGVAGVGLAYLMVVFLEDVARDSFGAWQPIAIDYRSLAVTAVVVLGAGILFGVAPAVNAFRVQLHRALSEGGGRGVAGRSRRWPARCLVLAQVALVTVLLVSAGVLMRSFLHLQQRDPGFDPENVLATTISLNDARYATSSAVNRLFSESQRGISSIPGVVSAGVSLSLPYERGLNMNTRIVSGGEAAGERLITNYSYVTPGYFETLGVPLLRGRGLRASDLSDGAKVAVVNQAFVKRYLSAVQPLGVQFGRGEQIVGVVGDIQVRPGWGTNSPLWESPTIYIPAAQANDAMLGLVHTWFSPSWVVRTAGPLPNLRHAIERVIQQTDPLLPVRSFQSLDELQYRSIRFHRAQAGFLAGFAALALLLAAVGLYGLIASSIVERTRELGIRLALGSTVSEAVRSAAGPGLALTFAGVLLGGGLALWAVRGLQGVVWGVEPIDPLSFLAAGVILVGVGALASFLPAARIVRLDPASTLRND